MAINAKREEPIQVKQFRTQLEHAVELLDVDRAFTSRHLNDGFSGGEKKRAEILQMAMLKPEIAILDETDSGLDIDSIKFVAEAVNRMRGPELGVLIITHYTRILEYIKPDYVHVLVDGKFVLSGGPEIADRLEQTGYSEWMAEDEPAVLKPEEVS
jgi:Fe-S cluster assembly ATP-binding protein